MDKIYKVLFVCTGNSARSIMAEALLNYWGKNHFQAYSAGSHPTGEVHPLAIQMLQKAKLPVADLRSKDWNEFASPDAPALDFVFTVCDKAAGEVCPAWPGQPMTAHWGVADPAAVEGSEENRKKAFWEAYLTLETRIKIFTSLRPSQLDKLSLQKQLDSIGSA